MLWEMAPRMLRVIYEILSLNMDTKRTITTIESKPPEKLKRLARNPRVKKTKMDLKIAKQTAYFLLKKNTEYITTIFERPSFTPGGKNGIGGKKLSIIESTTIIASISPPSATFFVFIISPTSRY